MQLGVTIFPTETTLAPADLGREAEDRGFESVWFPEHSHIPTSRVTPWGGKPGAAPMPEFYPWMYDQFVALAMAAAVTSRIKLGASICLVPQRDVIWLAKQVASLDRLSGGRYLFGVGYGWNREELAHHGIRYCDRRAVLRESVFAMREIWAHEEAEFHGDHLSFSPIWSRPKPVQQPYPPIILGAEMGPRTAAHVAEFCDGWIPVGSPTIRGELAAGIEEIRRECAERGRDPASIEVTVWCAKPDARVLNTLRDQGVHRAVLLLQQGEPSAVLHTLDEFAGLLSATGA